MVEPALWSASVSPATVTLDIAPEGQGNALAPDLDRWPVKLTDRILADGRHLVLGDADGFHHIWMRDWSARPLAYLIIRDAAIEMRQQAVLRLDRRLAGAPPSRKSSAFLPAPRQRRRLELLLEILDLQQGGERPVTSYDIARQLLYPDMTLRRGSDWKASNQRRRTMRLIDQARTLMNGGYRELLRGIVPG